MKKENFTVERGIEVQKRQLNNWKLLLKKEVYNALYIYATKDNNNAITGFDICRGDRLSFFVENYLYYKKQNTLETILGE